MPPKRLVREVVEEVGDSEGRVAMLVVMVAMVVVLLLEAHWWCLLWC